MIKEEINNFIIEQINKGKYISEIGLLLNNNFKKEEIKEIINKKLEKYIKEDLKINIKKDIEKYLENKLDSLRNHLNSNKKDKQSLKIYTIVKQKQSKLIKKKKIKL